MQKEIVMCVDDESQVVTSLKLLLEDDYDVLTFTDPKAALAEYQKNEKIIAVISDHRMPMMNGLQMFIKMKETCPDHKSFNIIYSGYSEVEGEMTEMIKSKVIHEFLTKSCPTRMLLKVLNDGIARTRNQIVLEQTQSV